MTKYYKIHQRGPLWHYVKLLDARSPKAMEVLNFLNPVPQIYFWEIIVGDPGSQIEYEALNSATPIGRTEYERAYEQATQGAFDVYIEGQKQ